MSASTTKRLLVVSDNDTESTAIVHMVKYLGYEGHSTWSGRDALTSLAADQFDLVLVDECVSDIYVGDFIERELQLPNCPAIGLIQTTEGMPIKYDRSFGKCRAFAKNRLDKRGPWRCL